MLPNPLFLPLVTPVGRDPFALRSLWFSRCEVFPCSAAGRLLALMRGGISASRSCWQRTRVSAFLGLCQPGLSSRHFVPDAWGPYACRTGSSVGTYQRTEQCQILFVLTSGGGSRGGCTQQCRTACQPSQAAPGGSSSLEESFWPLCICQRL